MNESEDIEMHDLARATNSAIAESSSPTHQTNSAPNTRQNGRDQEANVSQHYYHQFDGVDLRSPQSRGASPETPQAEVGSLTYLELVGDCNQGRPDIVRPESDHYDRLPFMGGQSGHRDTELTSYGRNPFEAWQTSTTNYHRKPTGRKRYILIALVILVVPCVFLAAVLAGILLIGQQIENSMENKLFDFQANMSNTLSGRRDFNESKFMFSARSDSPELRVKYKNICYCVYTKKLSWFEPRDFCFGLGPDVHLAEIKSAALNTYLMPHLVALFRTPRSVWLGASDIVTSGVWLWNSTGTSVENFTPTQWKEGHPAMKFTERCVKDEGNELKSFRWNTAHCTSVFAYMCQSPEVGKK